MLTVLPICMLLAEMGTASRAREVPTHGLFINEGAKVSEIRHAKVCQFGSPARTAHLEPKGFSSFLCKLH
jgi:hypothetical protein